MQVERAAYKQGKFVKTDSQSYSSVFNMDISDPNMTHMEFNKRNSVIYSVTNLVMVGGQFGFWQITLSLINE